MKKIEKILIPTDFSDFASDAAKSAITIGNHFESQMTLYHLFQVQSSTGSFASARDIIRKDALNDMAALNKELAPLVSEKASLNTVVVEANTVDAIIGKAKREAYDLIVMGTQGASGLKEVFMGSIANSVLKRTNVPMLAIPENAPFKKPKTIVLAVDDKGIDTAENFELLYLFAKSFEAELKIVHIETGVGDLEFASQIKYFFEGIPYEYINLDSSDNFNNTINQFVKEQDADLLCMIRRKRSFFQRVFLESNTSKEIFNSPVPLLILQA